MSGYEVLHQSPSWVEVLFNRLPSDYFDRADNLSLWSIVKLFITGSWPSLDYDFLYRKELIQNTKALIFTVQISCDLTPEIRLVKKNKQVQMFTSSMVHYIGRSSIVIKTSIFNYITKELLGNFFVKYVSVDENSGKSKPLPQWYKGKFSDKLSNPKTGISMPNIPDPPDTVYHIPVLTRFSDMDKNYHVTTSKYFEFFMDCASEAAISGFYKHFVSDMCLYPVKAFYVSMLGESRSGQKLMIYTWQDESDLQKIYFICYNDDECVMKAVFEYELTKVNNLVPKPRL